MALSTPVVLFIFNRPELTARVFSAIAQVKPRRLLIAADGPRSPEEAERCAMARAVVEDVDWECEVSRNYADRNLGCGVRISSALDWVFTEVEEAIVLEDDTLPDPSFFLFAQNLLERYRQDERVMHISGDNFQQDQRRGPHSYYFSRHAHIWGWATWRRAWKHYDFKMRTWPEFRDRGLLGSITTNPAEQRYWRDHFDREYSSSRPDTWDYQWLYAVWSQNGLAILPQVNLVSNLGFGPGATHTRDHTPAANVPRACIGALDHPSLVVADPDADAFTFEQVLEGTYWKEHRLRRYLLVMLPPALRKSVFAVWRRLNARTAPPHEDLG